MKIFGKLIIFESWKNEENKKKVETYDNYECPKCKIEMMDWSNAVKRVVVCNNNKCDFAGIERAAFVFEDIKKNESKSKANSEDQE